MVIPSYRSFPVNAGACANITRRDWNLLVEVVRRWVDLCRPSGGIYRRLTSLVCLDPLDILQLDLTLDMLRIYLKQSENCIISR